MSVASRLMERFRSRLTRFVAKERDRTGCAKVAVKNVARKIGMGSLSIYRAMNGYGSVRIEARHYVALLAASMAGSYVASKFRKSAQSNHAGLSA